MYSGPFSLTASLDTHVLEGSPANLILTVCNSDDNSVLFGETAFEESTFCIIITDASGKAVPRTALGDRVLTPPMYFNRNISFSIQPGQTLSYNFNLARLFDLTRPGRYIVRVSRSFVVGRTFLSPISCPDRITLTTPYLTVEEVADPELQCGPEAAEKDNTACRFLYAASGGAPGISRFRVSNDGAISDTLDTNASVFSATLVSDATANAAVTGMAASPDGRYLYVSTNNPRAIEAFKVGDNGVLALTGQPTPDMQNYPGDRILDPTGKFLYREDGAVFMISPDGRLTATRPCAKPPPPGQAAIVPSGKYLYVSNGETYGYRIEPDGTLVPLPRPRGTLTGLDSVRDTAIAVNPSGKFAYIIESDQLPARHTDLVQPALIGANGVLSAIPNSTVALQTPPLSTNMAPSPFETLTVDPTGRFLVATSYVCLDCFRIRGDGTLSPLGEPTQATMVNNVFFVPGVPLMYAISANRLTVKAYRLDNRQGIIPTDVNVAGFPFNPLVASTLGCLSLKWGAAVNGLQVALSTAADVAPASSPVVVRMTLRNTCGRPIVLSRDGSDLSACHLSIVGPRRGRPGALSGPGEPAEDPIPFLAAGRDAFSGKNPAGKPIVLPSGAERGYRLVLTQLADLTVPGFYDIQVSRDLPDGTKATSPILHLLLTGPYDGEVHPSRAGGVEIR